MRRREQKRLESTSTGGRWRTEPPAVPLATATVGETLELWIESESGGSGVVLWVMDLDAESAEESTHPSMKEAKRHAFDRLGNIEWLAPTSKP